MSIGLFLEARVRQALPTVFQAAASNTAVGTISSNALASQLTHTLRTGAVNPSRPRCTSCMQSACTDPIRPVLAMLGMC